MESRGINIQTPFQITLYSKCTRHTNIKVIEVKQFTNLTYFSRKQKMEKEYLINTLHSCSSILIKLSKKCLFLTGKINFNQNRISNTPYTFTNKTLLYIQNFSSKIIKYISVFSKNQFSCKKIFKTNTIKVFFVFHNSKTSVKNKSKTTTATITEYFHHPLDEIN